MEKNRRIILLGNGMTWSLEGSYQRALTQIGIEAIIIDIPKRLKTKLPFAKIMSRLRNILDDRRWLIQLNREIAIEILEIKPEAIFVFCNAELIFSTLALLKTASAIKTVLIWPDTPFNLTPEIRLSAPLYDLVGTYSHASMPIFENIGFRKVIWLPLAADPEMHGNQKEPESFLNDISFIGNWRPEREMALSIIAKEFSNYRIKFSGLFWKENISNRALFKHISSTTITGKQYADFINHSYINLNIIDKTNYPAANMRFFEILVAYGLELASSCPEQENIFIENKDLMYFHDQDELCNNIYYCLNHKLEMLAIRKNAYEKVMSQHTYVHRAQKLIYEIDI